MSKKMVNNEVENSTSPIANRRNFIKGAGVALGATALSTFAAPAKAVTAPTVTRVANATSSGSILDKILSSKKIRFGVDLTFAPLQYKTAAGVPTGYIVDLAKKLADSLGATPEWVEIPFGSLFAAQAAGKFDMSGIAATIKPARAQVVLFAGAPAFVESNVVLLAPSSKIRSRAALNSSAVTIAVVVGSSQESAASLLYPKAKLKRLENQAALADVAAGRSNAMIVGEFEVADAIKNNRGLKVLKGAPVFVDENSFFMPAGDYDMKNYVDTWLRYETSHNTLAGLWDKYVGNDARKLGLQSVSVKSSWA
jgi:ABC-type amino acid transport substrate-binding protein